MLARYGRPTGWVARGERFLRRLVDVVVARRRGTHRLSGMVSRSVHRTTSGSQGEPVITYRAWLSRLDVGDIQRIRAFRVVLHEVSHQEVARRREVNESSA